MWSLLGKGEPKFFINGPGHMTKMAETPIYGKDPSKIFSATGRSISTKLGIKHRGLLFIIFYTNDNSGVTLTYFKARSKRCAAQKSGTSLSNLSSKIREHGRHAMLSFLSSLPIPVLRILDIEANRFYDRNHQMYEAALLTRCYTQHALRPFINAENNHQRHFIKIPFINKGMDFIYLPSIFQDKSVTSSIPDYFQNSEPPIICYKYNKPIRHTIFNFNKLVSDLDIHANTPRS